MPTSWLLPDGTDRVRMLDMDRRIRAPRRAAFAVLAVALLLSGPWLGYWTVIPLAVTAVLFRLAEGRIEHVRQPELALFAAWTGSQLIIAVSVALTGGPDAATLCWFALPVVTLGSRFSERGIVLGTAVTLVLLVAVAVGVDARAVLDEPPKLLAPAALVIGTALLVSVLMRSDVVTRAQAVIDPLTGMLNREALATRAAELQQQAAVTGLPVGLIVGDLDHFKRVNDTHGHAVGDDVLRDVARRMREDLRSFDAVFRLGGEEFLVVAAGAGLEATTRLAERLRETVAAEPSAEGVAMTMSFGVSATAPGEPFDYDRQFGAADAELYRAKAEGRNRVCAAGAGVIPAFA